MSNPNIAEYLKPIEVNFYDYDNTLFHTEFGPTSVYDIYAGKIFGEDVYNAIFRSGFIEPGKNFFDVHIDFQDNYKGDYLRAIKDFLSNKLDKLSKDGSFLYENFLKNYNPESKDYSIYDNADFENYTKKAKEQGDIKLSKEELEKILFTEENTNTWCKNMYNLCEETIKLLSDENHMKKKELALVDIPDDSMANFVKKIQDLTVNFYDSHKSVKSVSKIAGLFYQKIFFKMYGAYEIFHDNCEINLDLIKKFQLKYDDGYINKINSLKDFDAVYSGFKLMRKYAKDENVKFFAQQVLDRIIDKDFCNIFGTDKYRIKKDSDNIIHILLNDRLIKEILICAKIKMKNIDDILEKEKIDVNPELNEKIKTFKTCIEKIEDYIKMYVENVTIYDIELKKEIYQEVLNDVIPLIHVNVIGNNYSYKPGSDLDNYMCIFTDEEFGKINCSYIVEDKWAENKIPIREDVIENIKKDKYFSILNNKLEKLDIRIRSEYLNGKDENIINDIINLKK